MEEMLQGNEEDNPFSFKNFLMLNDQSKNVNKVECCVDDENHSTLEDTSYRFTPLFSAENPSLSDEETLQFLPDTEKEKKTLFSSSDLFGLNNIENKEEYETNIVTPVVETDDKHSLSDATLSFEVSEINHSKTLDNLELNLSQGLSASHETTFGISDSTHSLPFIDSHDLTHNNVKLKKTLIVSKENDLCNEKDDNNELLQQIKQLKSENKSLKADLHKSQQQNQDKTQRVKSLESEFIALRKKESEETAALEEIIQKVEANLTTTTERALKAEKSGENLKQELKSLQNKVQTLTAENLQLLRKKDPGSAEEKIKYISQQLGASANTAEQSLKHLLEGVDNLKMLSEMLLSVDKFTEIND